MPRPWDIGDEQHLFKNALDQVELADRLSVDFAWMADHHCLEKCSHCPAYEVFLGAASQRTKDIRLGQGIIQLTTNHNTRVAERVATLDLISDGRVEFGMSEGGSLTEFGPFDRTIEAKREVWEDTVRAMMPHFQFPLRNVLRKPVQRPHPPLWVACLQLKTIEYAGRRGMVALGFQFISDDAAHAWVHAYYNSYTKRMDKLT